MQGIEHKPTQFERDLWGKKKTEYDVDMDDETPRAGVSGLKLDMAEKEKDAFMNELK